MTEVELEVERPTIIQLSDEWWALHPHVQRCIAHRTRTGEPCKKMAIKGGVVCTKHGGAAEQVRNKARTRLVMAADTAIEFITKIMNDETEPTPIRLAAAKDLADRNSLTGKQQVELSTPAWEGIIPAILVSVPRAVDEAERTIDGTYEELTTSVEDDPSTPELEPTAEVEESHPIAANVKVPAHTAARMGLFRR